MFTITLVGALCTALGTLTGLALAGARIRQQRHALLAARHDATHDALTSLPNRRALFAHLTASLRHQRPIGLVLLDLDNFKHVNDTLGHAAGDTLLRTVATRLLALPAADMVARLGGDEFVLVVQTRDRRHSGAEQTGLLAHTARHAIAQPVQINQQLITVQTSAGFTVTDGHAPTPDPVAAVSRLLHHADLALYHAKATRSGVHAHLPGPDHPAPPHRPTRRPRDLRHRP